MHRNTFALITVLAIFSALVAGVNISKKMSHLKSAQTTEISVKPTLSQLESSEKPIKVYSNSGCAVTFPIPDQFTLTNESTLSALFTRSDQKSSMIMTCQKDIPRPPIPTGSIETVKLMNNDKTTIISAKLYHDQSPSDDEKIDALIYYNPKIKMDVFIAGYGPEFNAMRESLRLLP